MRTFIGLFSFFIGVVASAQTDLSFPDSAAAWTNAFYYYPPPPPGPELTGLTSYCAGGQDTLISGMDYKKIDTCGGGYKGAIRVLDEQVYFVPKDSLQEFLLYDFSLVYGDTAYNVYLEDHYGGAYVTDVRIYSDADWLGTQGRRAFDTSESVWIQGIGSYTGLFMNSGANVSNYLIELYCMSHLDSTIYGYPGCPVFLGMDDEQQRPQLSFHPNPTTGRLIVRATTLDLSAVRVYSALGRELTVPVYFIGGEITMDLSSVLPGVYIVQVVFPGHLLAQRIVRE
ncbi:MAG TPA: T9SS type A sorting domain-containing protein [Flavobacteriales bacterium]|nr:T9SS type A sorting domain-containing protein [Flavobacteriales bacterium]